MASTTTVKGNHNINKKKKAERFKHGTIRQRHFTHLIAISCNVTFLRLNAYNFIGKAKMTTLQFNITTPNVIPRLIRYPAGACDNGMIANKKKRNEITSEAF